MTVDVDWFAFDPSLPNMQVELTNRVESSGTEADG